MADKQVNLNLVLTARDEATAVIESFVRSISDSVKGIQDAISTSMNMNGLTDSAKVAAESVNTSVRNMEESMTGLERTMNEVVTTVDEAMGRMGSNTNAHGAEVLMGFQQIAEGASRMGEGIAHGLEYAISQAADFDTSMAQIGAVLTTAGRASTEQMSTMQQTALNLGMNSKFTANEIAQGMYDLARQGLDASQILGNGVSGAIEVVNNLAQATDTNLADTAGVITDVMHEFGASGDQLVTFANMISGAMHNSNISMTDFLTTMRNVGPVASNMHQSITDTSTAIALLAQHGIKGSQAGTALKNMLLGLTPTTSAAKDAFKALGLSVKNGASNGFFDLNGQLKPMPQILEILHQHMDGLSDAQKQMYLHTIFTKYGLAGMNVLIGESGQAFGKLSDELKKDDAATIAGKKMDSLGGDIHKAQSAGVTLAKAFGESVRPELRAFAQAVQQVANWVNHLSEPTKKAIMVVAGLTATLLIVGSAVMSFAIAFTFAMPALLKFGEWFAIGTAGVGRFGGVIRALTLAPLIKGFGGAGTAVAGFVGKFLTLGAIFPRVGKLATVFLQSISNLHWIVGDALKAIGSSFTKMGALIYTAIPRMMASFTRFSILIYTSAPRILAAMTRAFSWTNIVKLVQVSAMAIRAALTLMTGPWGILIAVVVGGVALLITHWNQILNWVKEHFHGDIPSMMKNLETTFSKIWSNIKSAIQDAWDYIAPTIMNGIQQVQQWWNKVWPEVYQVLDFTWKAMLVLLAPTIATISTIIIAGIGFIKAGWQNAWNAIVDVLKMVWTIITGVISTAWSLISGIISVALDLLTGHFKKAGTDFVNTFKNAFSSITSMFSSLASEAFDFGKNFVSMIAKGITGAIGAVTSAVTNVAGTIKSFLGFHSPAETGPAGKGESDVWMSNLMGMLADGIVQNQPKVQNAVANVALGLKTGITSVNQNVIKSTMTAPNSVPVRGNGNQPIININIDGRSAKTDNDLANVIAQKIYRQMPVVSSN